MKRKILLYFLLILLTSTIIGLNEAALNRTEALKIASVDKEAAILCHAGILSGNLSDYAKGLQGELKEWDLIEDYAVSRDSAAATLQFTLKQNFSGFEVKVISETIITHKDGLTSTAVSSDGVRYTAKILIPNPDEIYYCNIYVQADHVENRRLNAVPIIIEPQNEEAL